jgi:hypothetical protein
MKRSVLPSPTSIERDLADLLFAGRDPSSADAAAPANWRTDPYYRIFVRIIARTALENGHEQRKTN